MADLSGLVFIIRLGAFTHLLLGSILHSYFFASIYEEVRSSTAAAVSQNAPQQHHSKVSHSACKEEFRRKPRAHTPVLFFNFISKMWCHVVRYIFVAMNAVRMLANAPRGVAVVHV